MEMEKDSLFLNGGWIVRRMNGWIVDRWIDEWMDGGMDGYQE